MLDRKKGKGTAVGNALRWLTKQGRTVAPELLEIAGSITGIKQLEKLADKISGDLDLSSQDKELLLKQLDFDILEMQEVTKRLQLDNEHPITRLVRPVSYGLMFVMFLSMVMFDGNIGTFVIKDIYIPVIESLFGTMTIFYFGSRGAEKIAKLLKK